MLGGESGDNGVAEGVAVGRVEAVNFDSEFLGWLRAGPSGGENFDLMLALGEHGGGFPGIGADAADGDGGRKFETDEGDSQGVVVRLFRGRA